MIRKIRLGNDIDINWAIVISDDTRPYILEGKDLKLELICGTKFIEITEFDVNENVIHFMFYGKDQKYEGLYVLKLTINEGEESMVTFDTNNSFMLVEHSWAAKNNHADVEKMALEFLELSSAINIDVGVKGDPGESAYEIAVDHGFVGTEEEWLASLQGEPGPAGPVGPRGPAGSDAQVTKQNIELALGYSPVDPSDLSTVATTGEYRDILHTPAIPTALSELTSDISHRTVTDIEKVAWNAKYDKPNTGIPKTDLASDVQTSLGKADTALQEHQDISGKADKSEMSVSTSGDKTTITLNEGTFAEVLNQHQDLTPITELIPAQATSSNQLADKEFVNSSISTNTATFQGTYNSVSDLSLTTSATHAQIATALASEISSPDSNDYCFVQIPTSDSTPTEIASVERYKFNGTAWDFEFELNNSGYTAAQWAAINSGITSAHVTKLNGIASGAQVNVLEGVQVNGVDLTISNKKVNVDLSGKVDKVAGKQLSTEDYTTAEKTKLSGIETGAQVNDIEHIKIGATEQTISNKTVTLPASYPKADVADIAINNKTESKTDQEFVFRKTNNNWNAKTEIVKRIKGKTLAWNQLIKPDAYSRTTYDVVITNNGDGSFSGNGTSSGRVNISPTTVIINGNYLHKFLLRGGQDTTSYVNVSYYNDSTYITTPYADKGGGLIFTQNNSSVNRLVVEMIFAEKSGVNVSAKLWPNIFDLTLMFGAGNEPSTVAEFEALYPELYYPYNAGELISNDAKSLETVGFNIWDEEWEVGGYNTNTGAKHTSSDKFRSKNFIPVLPGQTYYGYWPTTYEYMWIYKYDANKNYLGYTTLSPNGTLTIPSGCYYITFNNREQLNQPYYNNDICINLSDASRNGTYEPYWKRKIDLNLDSFKVKDKSGNIITVNGLKSAGSVYDEIVGNKYIKRIGEVDMGDLTYTVSYSVFRSALSNIKKSASVNSVANLLCVRYRATTPMLLNNTDMSIASDESENKVGIKDTNYTDAASFKTAMSGVMLYYELATPVEYQLVEPMPSVIRSDYDGTERAIFPEHEDETPSAPFRADIQYGTNDDDLLDERENETVYEARVAQKMREIQSFNEVIDFKQVSVTGVNDAYRLDRIEGKTLAWNQVLYYDFSTPSGLSNSSWLNKSASNGVLTLENTASEIKDAYVEYNFQSDTNLKELVVGHKYLWMIECYREIAYSDGTAIMFFPGAASSGGSQSFSSYGKWERLALVRTIVSGSIQRLRFYCSTPGATHKYRNSRLIDVTLLYGTTIDGMTNTEILAKYESDFGTGYHNYNPGQLISNGASGLETVGFNVWDEEWESGVYAIYSPSGNGEKLAESNYIRCKNAIPCIPNTDYFIYSSNSIRIAAYDDNGNYLGYDSARKIQNGGAIYNTPNNAHYLRFYIDAFGVITYNHDICVNLSDESRNGQYEPYKRSVLPLNLDDFWVKDSQGNRVHITGGLKSAGSIYDEIRDGKFIKRVGSVDLGTLTWSYGYGIFYSAEISDLIPILHNPNGICGKYPISTEVYSNMPDKSLLLGDSSFSVVLNRLYIKDSSYSDDQLAFKTAMSGVYLYYELATPVEYELESPLYIGRFFEDGTMRATHLDETAPNLPIVADVTYGVNTGCVIDWALKVVSSFKEKLETLWNAVFNGSSE